MGGLGGVLGVFANRLQPPVVIVYVLNFLAGDTRGVSFIYPAAVLTRTG